MEDKIIETLDEKLRNQEDFDKWFEQFKDRYNKLSDKCKYHLSRACPDIVSIQQAEDILHFSEMFDLLFFKTLDNDKIDFGA